MKIKEIAFTVLPVINLAAARRFYEGVLGLESTSVYGGDEVGMVEYEIGQGTVTIGSGASLFKPGLDGGAVALEVEDFDAAITHLREHGVRFLSEPMETPVCHMATIADPDGNFLIIHRRKDAEPEAGMS